MTHPFTFTEPTDKMPGGWHGAYLKPYALLLERIHETEDSICEIGCDGGGSILMYANYFRDARRVVSCDISPCPKAVSDAGIIHFQGDAYSKPIREDIAKLGPYAWMVDDGPHTLSSQLSFCHDFPHMLSEDGIACVEDVQSVEHFPQLSQALPPEFFGFGIDLRMHDARYDNLLFIITRR